MEYTLYHGSTESFTQFDEAKIKADETDALYNGFWFTSDENTSPAFRNAKYMKKCLVTLNNPAPHEVIKQVIETIENTKWYENEQYRSLQDAVRITLKSLGYDGIIFNEIPRINEEELYSTGEIEYRTARGNRRKLKAERDGIDLYTINSYGREEFITGYEDLKDFLGQQELTIVVFSSNQIKILEETCCIK